MGGGSGISHGVVPSSRVSTLAINPPNQYRVTYLSRLKLECSSRIPEIVQS
jgi:hypothetical protein